MDELIDERTQIMPLTVEQYHELIAAGQLAEGEPYELLCGLLVRKDRSAAGKDAMTVSHEHALAVTLLTGLDARLKRLGCHIRIQQPVTLPPYDEPEPDAVVVKGAATACAGRHPGPKDIACVFEVADSSLRRDRTVKLRIYADSGIGQYVILNLPDRLIEVYTEPLAGKGRYGHVVTLRNSQKLDVPAAGGRRLTISVRHLMP